ncbi:MAG: putative tellurite resistance protein B-like protein [Paraglaciecola sp.]|jgi:uncharacterized tellurite resistance protein B-like protein
MLSKLITWFEDVTAQSDNQQPEHKVELATAVLLYEIMRADGQFEAEEKQVYHRILTQHFSLDDQELASLTTLTEEQVEKAIDFSQFTRVINDVCDAQEKRKILDGLWHLAYADDSLDPEEEYLIRKIADLLYIPHSQFIQSKLAASSHI